jgi:dTDP-4-dehydrorhamnose reductase
VYGHSKREGELATLAANANNLVIRVCGLYGVWGSGGKGGNFVETMLRVAGQGKPLRVVNDQRCTPTYTADVATATVSLIQHAATGIYHITNSGDCSWCEFAAEIFRQSNLAPSLTPITTAEFGAAAKRPLYSVLAHTKLAALQLPAMRDWRSALTAYLAERQNKPAA